MAGYAPSEATDDPRCAVLLVEDDPFQRALYEHLLRRWGYHTVAVSDHDGARRALVERACDVVVSDVFLGDVTGFDLARSFRDAHPEVPVVLISAHESTHMRTEALRRGATAFVAKSEADPKLQHAVFDALLWSMHESATRRHAPARDAVFERHGALGEDLFEAFRRLRATWRPVFATRAPRRLVFECSARSDWSELSDASALLRAASERDALTELGRRLRAAVGSELTRRPDLDTALVKLSPRELCDDALFSSANPLLPHAHRVALDFGDAVMCAMIPGARARLARLRAMGFRVSLYDASPTRSDPRSHLSLPHDLVAIDYGVVRICGRPSEREACLRAIATQHWRRGVEVLVDGVETAEERRVALGAEVDYAQGGAIGASRSLPPAFAS